ncbi:MAG: diaminopimelate decarboxylase [Armatimonadetes bacterium]|nr:diaminopimelate decarboxylase [Armatimonadota bacterium]
MLLGTQTVNDRGHLEIGGCDTAELAQTFGTPLYVVDEQTVRDNCRRYVRAFADAYPGESKVTYAGKAFLIQAMARLVDEEGLGLDVASAGELHTALTAGFPAERILMHGNNKSDAEIAMGLDAGIGRFVVDNFFELRRLSAMAQARGKRQPILIRVTPGIDPKTHRRIRTGQEDTKFGINISEGSALAAVTEALRDLPGVELTGIHCHIGSQLLDPHTHEQAIEIMVAFLAEIRATTGYTVADLDIGGGLGVRYLESQTPPTYEEFAAILVPKLLTELRKHDLPLPRLWQEPGRTLVAEAGTTLYTIGHTKRVLLPEAPGERFYVSVDGGMSDNPRPQLYDAVYSAMVANRAGQAKDKVFTVAGKHCETDILIWDIALGDTDAGDILAVQTTGAYNQAMASNYNRFTRPAVVFVRNGAADVVVERETLDDVIRQDRLPARLRKG